jgi:exodeoxyribonuclease-3
LTSREDDIIVLTEISGGPGGVLLVDGLAAQGYTVVRTSTAQDRGVAVATRLRVEKELAFEPNVTLPWRVAAIQLADFPLAIVGIYVPSRDRSPAKIARKRKFIQSLLAAIARLPSALRGSMVIAGDYNVVSRNHLPRLTGYFPYEYQLLESLTGLGFVAGHELYAAGPYPHSWIGRTGTGYLYDYFHFAKRLSESVQSCTYDHTTRERRLSDHAAVAAVLGFS